MTHPNGGSGSGSSGNSGTGPARFALRLADLVLDSLAALFKVLPRGARR